MLHGSQRSPLCGMWEEVWRVFGYMVYFCGLCEWVMSTIGGDIINRLAI